MTRIEEVERWTFCSLSSGGVSLTDVRVVRSVNVRRDLNEGEKVVFINRHALLVMMAVGCGMRHPSLRRERKRLLLGGRNGAATWTLLMLITAGILQNLAWGNFSQNKSGHGA